MSNLVEEDMSETWCATVALPKGTGKFELLYTQRPNIDVTLLNLSLYKAVAVVAVARYGEAH